MNLDFKNRPAPYLGHWALNHETIGYNNAKTEHDILTTELDYFQARDNFEALKSKPKTLALPDNSIMLNSESFSTGTSFAGGSVEDLSGTKDISGYTRFAREHKSNFVKDYKFTPQLARKRSFNEHDGDWDMDRRWDIAPYEGVTKKPVQNPFVTLNVHCAFSCGVKSSEIDEYGYFIASLCNFLEANNYSIEVNYITITRDSCRKIKYHKFINKIKERSEYLSIQRILQVFSSNYYRRVKFLHTISGADLLNTKVDYGLGSPFSYDSSVSVKDGIIDIFADTDKAIRGTLIKEIKKGLGI